MPDAILGLVRRSEVYRRLADAVRRRTDPLGTSQAQQVLLRLQYQSLARAGLRADQMPGFRDVGFRCFSQFEEDGILLYIFSLIGSTNRIVVEIGAGDGRECMAANLLINHGWWGVLFDGRSENVAAAERFYRTVPDTALLPPDCRKAWITAENVNEVIAASGVGGSIDLLSIDLDGMDYWIWRAIEVVEPRCVVCETHDMIPSQAALTVRYDPAFDCWSKPARLRQYRGASLLAMVKLGRAKGYRFVGTHRHGFNAFFVREDLCEPWLPEASIEHCHDNPWTRRRQEVHWPLVRDLGWQEV